MVSRRFLFPNSFHHERKVRDMQRNEPDSEEMNINQKDHEIMKGCLFLFLSSKNGP